MFSRPLALSMLAAPLLLAAAPAPELEPDSPQSVDEALAQLRERLSRGRED